MSTTFTRLFTKINKFYKIENNETINKYLT